MIQRASKSETSGVIAAEISIDRTTCQEETPGVKTVFTAVQQLSGTRSTRTYPAVQQLFCLTVGKVGKALAGLIRKFKSQALTDDNGQRAWLSLMDKDNHESEEILRKAMSKLMNLKIDNGEDPDTPFSEADSLREMEKRHRKMISDRPFKGATIRFTGTTHFSFDQIKSIMRSIYRAANQNRREKGSYR